MKNKLPSIMQKTLGWIIALIPVIAAIALAAYYITGPGEGYFHSDCSDSMYWANATVEAGKVFDESYRYAALLPFSASTWMVPLIQIFGFGMTAHNIAMVIFAVLFAGSIWFCCSSCGFGKIWCGISVFTVFMLLSSSEKLREILWGHSIYYSVGLIILFTLVGLCVRIINSFENKKYVRFAIWSVLSCALAAGAATDGMQVIVLAALPVAGGLFAERVFCHEDNLFSRKTAASVVAFGLVCVGTVIGLRLLKKFTGDTIEASYADAYSGWSNIESWFDNAKQFVVKYFTLIGVEIPDEEKSLFSKEAIPAIIRIGVGIVVLAAPVVMIFFYKKLSKGTKIMLFAHFIESAAIMFGFICGKLSGANWRLTPLFGSAVLLTVFGARELCVVGFKSIDELIKAMLEKNMAEPDPDLMDVQDEIADAAKVEKKPLAGNVGVRLGACITAALLLCSLISAKEIKKMEKDFGQDNYNHRLAAFLEEKGLEYGYGTFWYCQAITVISESKVKCREVLANGQGVYSDYYQSSRNWYTGQDYDKFFILLSLGEYQSVKNSTMWKNAIEYRIDDFTAYNEDDEAAGYGVAGFVITVFDRNVLDENVMGE